MEAARGVGDVGGDAEVRPNCAAPHTLFMVSTSSGSFAVSAAFRSPAASDEVSDIDSALMSMSLACLSRLCARSDDSAAIAMCGAVRPTASSASVMVATLLSPFSSMEALTPVEAEVADPFATLVFISPHGDLETTASLK